MSPTPKQVFGFVFPQGCAATPHTAYSTVLVVPQDGCVTYELCCDWIWSNVFPRRQRFCCKIKKQGGKVISSKLSLPPLPPPSPSSALVSSRLDSTHRRRHHHRRRSRVNSISHTPSSSPPPPPHSFLPSFLHSFTPSRYEESTIYILYLPPPPDIISQFCSCYIK